MARLLVSLALLTIVTMAVALDRYPESRDNACYDPWDCVTTATCQPGAPDPRTGLCSLHCCYPSGAIAYDSAYCCDPENSVEITSDGDSCGIWACASPCHDIYGN